jgi:uncharacterized membrane protein required for colicin V production
MGGIEVLAATIILMLGTIGLVRGASKELGVTMALIVLLAVLSQFDNLVAPELMPARVNNLLANVGLDSDNELRQRTMVWFLYSAVTVITAFLAYHGQDTLAFKFEDPHGIGGVVFGWIAGAVNGYLIFGTIWYYLDRLGYPIQQYEWFDTQFTTLGRNLIAFLPQNIASGIIMSAIALALLWWRILR